MHIIDMCEVNISDHKLLQEYEETFNPYSNKYKTIQILQD